MRPLHIHIGKEHEKCNGQVCAYADFLRVGPLKRMDKALLPYSLHCSESSSSNDALKELKDMLLETTDPVEQLAIKTEMTELQQVRSPCFGMPKITCAKRVSTGRKGVWLFCCVSEHSRLYHQSAYQISFHHTAELLDPWHPSPGLQYWSSCLCTGEKCTCG